MIFSVLPTLWCESVIFPLSGPFLRCQHCLFCSPFPVTPPNVSPSESRYLRLFFRQLTCNVPPPPTHPRIPKMPPFSPPASLPQESTTGSTPPPNHALSFPGCSQTTVKPLVFAPNRNLPPKFLLSAQQSTDTAGFYVYEANSPHCSPSFSPNPYGFKHLLVVPPHIYRL